MNDALFVYVNSRFIELTTENNKLQATGYTQPR